MGLFAFNPQPGAGTLSGEALVVQIQDMLKDLAGHRKGSARPSDVQTGELWLDDSASPWVLKLWDGASDIPVMTVDPARHALALSGLTIGTDVQGYSDILAALAGLSPSASKLPYFTAAAAMALTTLTSFARSILNGVDAAAVRALLDFDTDGSMSANSDSNVPTQKAVRSYVDGKVDGTSARDLAVFNSIFGLSLADSASRAVPGGFAWMFKTDELATKTNGFYTKPGYANFEDPSYSNSGGQGNRTAIITVNTTFSLNQGTINNLVDGSSTDDSAGSIVLTGAAATGKYIRFQFEHAVKITEATLTQSAATAQGTAKWQGSNNGSDWTDIGSAFAVGGATSQAQTELSGNTGYYLYYRLLWTDGSVSAAPWVREIIFKISNTENAEMTLKPSALTASAEPALATFYMLHKAVDTVTLGTDLKVRMSLDGGSNWSGYGTISSICAYDTDYNLLKAVVDISALTGVNVVWEITTTTARQVVSRPLLLTA